MGLFLVGFCRVQFPSQHDSVFLINDLVENMKSLLIKFAYYTEIDGVVNNDREITDTERPGLLGKIGGLKLHVF